MILRAEPRPRPEGPREMVVAGIAARYRPDCGMDSNQIPEVSVDELATLIGKGIVVIDVRSPEEYAEGHVPGARLLPLEQIGERAGEVPTDCDVYLICRSGGRSARALGILNAHGRRGFNVAGGTLGWIDAGHAVVEGSNEG